MVYQPETVSCITGKPSSEWLTYHQETISSDCLYEAVAGGACTECMAGYCFHFIVSVYMVMLPAYRFVPNSATCSLGQDG